MRIVNREEFLNLDDPVLYIKCDQWGNPEGQLSISYGRSSEKSNDFVTVPLHGFIKEWCGSESPSSSEEHNMLLRNIMKDKNTHFELDYTMTSRDGLYENNQLFMVYEKLDILKLIFELNKIYDHKYHKDDYACKYELY